jgi:hypothetical protein
MGVNGGDRFAVPMDWVGLRPSQVEQLKKVNGIEVFQVDGSGQATFGRPLVERKSSLDEFCRKTIAAWKNWKTCAIPGTR